MTVSERIWWKDGIVYQIYPASYKDSNGDGIGDIPGVISTLDYLKDLGVDIVWLSPHYDSPQHDMGYDVSNYEDVYAPYGRVADAEGLIEACHDRGMRIIFDLVINHTSDLHQWFKESRSSKHDPKRDWYIWRPARYNKNGERKPPNNWRSFFGGSAWEWDEATQEYYLHLFLTEQPDLNWENGITRDAVYQSAMTFWLDKGLDGFRVDTVNMYSKGLELPDAPVSDNTSEWQVAHSLFCNGPRMHEFLREMNQKILSNYDTMIVGELPHTPDADHVLRYVSAKDRQLDMVFQFDAVDLGQGHNYKLETRPWSLTELKSAISSAQSLAADGDGWTTAFLENHDQARSISRFASDHPKYHAVSGKMLAIFLATLTGTLFIYQGQEIGTINCPKNWPIEEYKDVASLNYYNMIKERSGGERVALDAALDGIQKVARDHARAPMQWDDTPHAGFTTGTPWMRAHDRYPSINVKQQRGDKNSIFHFWKKMLALRKKYTDLFVHGKFEILDCQNESTFTYTKTFKGDRSLVALNFTGVSRPFSKPAKLQGNLTLLVSNVEPKEETLEPYEGRVYLVDRANTS
ncbi:hypothetical protein MMC12_006901 [Toensbergia leucococca]|nr:hypothetical protein [Toensbergia leucococca]